MHPAIFIGGVVIVIAAIAFLVLSRRRPKASAIEARRLAFSDSGDVLVNADRRMALGYFEDAASLVATALASEPTRTDLQLKLLEVYFIWGKQAEFSAVVRQHQHSLRGTGEWVKVETMGKQLCPGDSLFAAYQGGAA